MVIQLVRMQAAMGLATGSSSGDNRAIVDYMAGLVASLSTANQINNATPALLTLNYGTIGKDVHGKKIRQYMTDADLKYGVKQLIINKMSI